MINAAAVNAANALGYEVPGVNVPADELGRARYDVEKAEGEAGTSLQDMFRQRRENAARQVATSNGAAKLNALGNVFRSLVQPLGWAVGGATAPVQPYDSRQYLDAYNRAVRAGDEYNRIGAEEQAYRLKSAEERAREARRKADLLEAEQRRRDALLEKNATPDYEGRKTSAINSYYLHGRPNKVSIDEWLDLGGRGEEYFGGWKPTKSELEDISVGEPRQTPAPESQAPATEPSGTQATGGGSNARTRARGLTADEQAVIKAWEKYDKDKNGKLSSDEMKRGLFSLRKPKADENTASAYAAAIAKRDRLEGKKATSTNSKDNKEKPANARSIMGVNE